MVTTSHVLRSAVQITLQFSRANPRIEIPRLSLPRGNFVLLTLTDPNGEIGPPPNVQSKHQSFLSIMGQPIEQKVSSTCLPFFAATVFPDKINVNCGSLNPALQEWPKDEMHLMVGRIYPDKTHALFFEDVRLPTSAACALHKFTFPESSPGPQSQVIVFSEAS